MRSSRDRPLHRADPVSAVGEEQEGTRSLADPAVGETSAGSSVRASVHGPSDLVVWFTMGAPRLVRLLLIGVPELLELQVRPRLRAQEEEPV